MSRAFLPLLTTVALLCQPAVPSRTRAEAPRIADPTKIADVPGGFASRVAADRARLVKERGGSAASEAAVARGLKWLALHQAPDGRWSLDEFNKHAREKLDSDRYFDDGSTGKGIKNDIAGTAFGLLPFLAAGITHKTGEKQSGGLYTKTVARGLDYLRNKQGKDGGFEGTMYAHALATIVLCEAYALSGDHDLKLSARKALTFIVAAQDPDAGGWRYQPRQGSDTSVTGWQVTALKSGQIAGLTVPAATLKGAEKWLDSCETADKGGYGYVGPPGQETPTMSAVGLLCRQYLGTPRRNPGLRLGCENLKKTLPGTVGIYYEYYATQVMHHMGGDSWDFWNEGPKGKGSGTGMRDILIKKQDRDGSWDPANDAFGTTGGRIMASSLSLLTLEIYYRYQPLYQRIVPRKGKP